MQVFELVDQVAEQEIQLAQTHQREDVRGEDDERIGRDAEDRGNRVEREHQVGDAQGDEDDQDRREHSLAVDGGAQLRPVVGV